MQWLWLKLLLLSPSLLPSLLLVLIRLLLAGGERLVTALRNACWRPFGRRRDWHVVLAQQPVEAGEVSGEALSLHHVGIGAPRVEALAEEMAAAKGRVKHGFGVTLPHALPGRAPPGEARAEVVASRTSCGYTGLKPVHDASGKGVECAPLSSLRNSAAANRFHTCRHKLRREDVHVRHYKR